MIYEDERNEYVEIEAYLIPETRKLLNEIEEKTPNKVKLRKVYDNIKIWQIRSLIDYHIDMPSRDEGNIFSFTHELLHIYFDYVLGMKVSHYLLPSLVMPYNTGLEDPWQLPNYYINLINNLQHHKMVAYFVDYKFPTNKIIDNYENPIDIFDILDKEIKTELVLTTPFQKYVAALSFVNYLALELYFPNPAIREKLVKYYSKEYDKKFAGLRDLFLPLLAKWSTDYSDLKQLILDINDKAKVYAEKD